MGRVALGFSVLLVAALLVGYGAGSRRAAKLETFLDRLTLEYDALRGVAAEQAYQLDRITDIRLTEVDASGLERVRSELDRTLAFLGEARSASEEKTRLADERAGLLHVKEIELRDCNSVQTRLEEQLETCIFEKASLARSARTAPGQGADARPTTGVSPFTQSLDFPAGTER
jgi:hypothetical protein